MPGSGYGEPWMAEYLKKLNRETQQAIEKEMRQRIAETNARSGTFDRGPMDDFYAKLRAEEQQRMAEYWRRQRQVQQNPYSEPR